MKKYIALDKKIDWKVILPRLNTANIMLMNKPNGDFILAWGCTKKIAVSPNNYNAKTVQNFITENKSAYIFGYLSYDLKNTETQNIKRIKSSSDLADIHFFVAEHVVLQKNNFQTYFGEKSNAEITALFAKIETQNLINSETTSLKLIPETDKKEYVENIKAIKEKIQNGIIYEMNYCVNFNADFDSFNPYQAYEKLLKNTDAPFACFMQENKRIVLSASPERFINKQKNILSSQPIKGTAKRGKNAIEDAAILAELKVNPKEIAENVMIVDLVRNDLSKIAEKNSVNVVELCEPYSFKTVHQLISTIACTIKPKIDFTTILQALFPMGSMTGAPKISAMQNIAHFETFNRGIYSGAIGYIEPNGNFDFNVVIRTIIADMEAKKITASVGGAITIQSDPLDEYKECMLKLNALEKTLC